MTKLFSVKSLAFAGAAAFALTLAAAPQADAAGKITMGVGSLSHITVEDSDIKLTKTEDGQVIYYQVGKDENKIKEGKYTAIADENLGFYNFSKFSGKAQYLSISPDGKKDTATGVAIKAAPKLKAKYSATDGLELTIDNQKATISTEGGIKAKVGTKEYWVEGIYDYDQAIKSNIALGGTLEISVQELNSTDGIASPSKPVKVKIPAKPKAPKASLKLDATKAFTWKISAKQEYRITVGDDSTADGKWIDGSNNADGWASIVEKGISKTVADKVVSGDAILADTTISLRTKADKKAASSINVIKLDKSVASPTDSAVTVEITKASGKTATGASIKAVKDIQYSVEAGKWKKLTAGKTAKLKDTNKTVLVRIAGKSKNGFVLPSINTKVETDFAAGKATVSYVDYDTDGSCKVTTKTVEAK